MVDNGGYVTGLAPGKSGFIFTQNGTGCAAVLPNDAVSVKPCVDPDFNVTFANVAVSGNLSTNDEVPANTTLQWYLPIDEETCWRFLTWLLTQMELIPSLPTYQVYMNTRCLFAYLPAIVGLSYLDLTITVVDGAHCQKKQRWLIRIVHAMKCGPTSSTSVNSQVLNNDQCISTENCIVMVPTIDIAKSNNGTQEPSMLEAMLTIHKPLMLDLIPWIWSLCWGLATCVVKH